MTNKIYCLLILLPVLHIPMNETANSEIDLADADDDEYKHLRDSAAFIIEGVLLPILASLGIVGKYSLL